MLKGAPSGGWYWSALVGTSRHLLAPGDGDQDHGGRLGETSGALTMLNPQIVAAKQGFLGTMSPKTFRLFL